VLGSSHRLKSAMATICRLIECSAFSPLARCASARRAVRSRYLSCQSLASFLISSNREITVLNPYVELVVESPNN